MAARRIGIMQGRLLTSLSGELDSPAGSRWREEFEIAGRLRLNHVELLAERHRDEDNPIWSSEGRAALRTEAARSGIELLSLCVNEPLARPVDDLSLMDELAPRLADAAGELGLDIVVVPLLEASDLGDVDRRAACRSVRLLAEALPDSTRVALEVSVPASDSMRFVASSSMDRVGLCYDVGNATASGLDPAKEIRYLDGAVFHVHAKDKNAAKENVRFGTGEVDFTSVFDALEETGFDGLVTMEATRGDDPVSTAREHLEFLVSVASSREIRGPDDGL